MKLSRLVEELNHLIQQGLGEREVLINLCVNDMRATIDDVEQEGQEIIINAWEQ